MAPSGRALRDEVSTELLVHDQIGGIDLQPAVATDDRHGVVDLAPENLDAGQHPVDALSPLKRKTTAVNAPVNVDDHFAQVTVDELVAHCTDLLRNGYRPTRWHHPRHGDDEFVLEGEHRGSWKWTPPADGRTKVDRAKANDEEWRKMKAQYANVPGATINEALRMATIDDEAG
jgi:hypothetical protein